LTMIGITIGFHRLFSHVSFKTTKWMRMLLAILASMGSQGPLFTWVADHRRHHDLSDEEGDTHSPNRHGRHFIGRLRGFWHAHIGWMFTNQPASWARYIPDLMKDREMFWVHRHYFVWVFLGLLLPTLAGFWLIGSWEGAFSGFLWGGLVRIFATSQVVLSIGSLGHMFGSRPFRERTQDYSANNWWISLLSFGECLQSNHHAFPASARHGLRWWEPDFNYFLIRLWRIVGLVWDVKLPPNAAIIRACRLKKAPDNVKAA
jgi:stearoyl-CoA desaturase (delta-9 desaturase)